MLFFLEYVDFGSIFGGSGDSKNGKQSHKSRKNIDFGMCPFLEAAGTVLGGFWKDFGKGMEGFIRFSG